MSHSNLHLHFLGDDAPLPRRVREFLLPGPVNGIADLEQTLVVTPTKQAGRRLRETLACHCAEFEAALLAPRVVVPAFFLNPECSSRPVASLSLVAAVWADVLQHAPLAQYAALFPIAPERPGSSWALHTATLLQELRQTLGEAGLTIATVPDPLDEDVPEPARWRNLAELEGRYIDRLNRLGVDDPQLAAILTCETPEIPTGIERIVVAGVPDPTPLVVRALNRLAERVPVEILVHAPKEDAAMFDAWGRPITKVWLAETLEIPNPEETILLAGTQAGQSQRVLELLRDGAAQFPPGDSVVGVPDRSVVPFLVNELEDNSIKAFHPAPGYVADHRLYHLLDAWRNLLIDGGYDGLRAVLHHPDILHWLGAEVADLLGELDHCQNDHLPDTFEEIVRWSEPGYPILQAAVLRLQKAIAAFDSKPVPEAVSALLEDVFDGVMLDPASVADQEFMAVAGSIKGVLAEFEDGPLRELGLDSRTELSLLMQRLGEERVDPERGPADIELEGWLELAWNDARQMIITGMNEGFVPEGQCADVFLPDSLRERLGLRTDADRFAREAFLLRGLAASRREDGRLVLIAGKTTREGDPLKPSRLLFRCPDEELPARAERLFGEPSEPRTNVPATVSFPLDASLPADTPVLDRLHVTAFRGYLACPFRFYLSRIRKMAPLDDRKSELDALDFGNLIHHALEQMVIREFPLDNAPALAERLKEVATGWALSRYGSPLPLQVEIQLRAATQRLAAAADTQARLTEEGWVIERVEERIVRELDGMSLVGTIDRIDRHRSSGRLRLLDYKTSDIADKPERAHIGSGKLAGPAYAKFEQAGKAKTWVNLQLPLYRWLLDEDAPIEVGYFNLPRAIQETHVYLWDDLDDALHDAAVVCARGVIADVHACRFWPPSEGVLYDDFEALFHGDADACFLHPGWAERVES